MSSVPRLVALFGPKRGVTREFDRVLRIGRSHEADLQLIDERVSRDHCTLEVTPDGVKLRDLGSRNGTWLNGKRLDAPAVLARGDQLAVGESLLAFEPELDALRSREAEITVVLTKQQTSAFKRGPAAAEQVLQKVSEAKDAREAAALLADSARTLLAARTAAVMRCGPGEVMRAVAGSPVGAQLTVPAGLVEKARSERVPLSHAAEQTEAQTDDTVTRVHSVSGTVACAPMIRFGEVAGVLCVERGRDFSEAELAQLFAMAAAGAASLPAADHGPSTRPLAASASMRRVLELAEAAARAPSTVLLIGETGTGKEEVSRYVHACSPRRAGPFVALNCGAIPPELAESELFGHEKGAFTGAVSAQAGVFERADGGTLLLDEIGDLPAPMQVKLLRVLQDRLVTRVGGKAPFSVDVRVIAATHRDLKALVKAGTFREDLLWRLDVVRIDLPALRERADDVVPLAEHFLSMLSRRLGVAPEGFSPEAREALLKCPWPGNVRQLANAVERALVLKREKGPIGVFDLPPEVASPPAAGGQGPRPLAELIAQLEREQITLALHRSRGVKAAAAEALGISRPTLDRKIAELNIEVP
jgi:transcriptional regulator with PAS, ATPase and Fis domain/pSer/pThr/pTyr-binding forkhead associated (FHA) protein